MKYLSSLEQMKQVLRSVFSSSRSDAKISSYHFVLALLFNFLGHSKIFSLESIRLSLTDLVGKSLSKSTFWERLTTQTLSSHLEQALTQVISAFNSCFRGKSLLIGLDVDSIQLLDSTTNSLKDSAQKNFPGVFGHAGIKWHACLDALSGHLKYFAFSEASSHDRTYFPPLESLKRQLIIFDLGYWDYSLFARIEEACGFFLSRVKDLAVIQIKEIVKGLNRSYEGTLLFKHKWKSCRASVIEFWGEIRVSKKKRNYFE